MKAKTTLKLLNKLLFAFIIYTSQVIAQDNPITIEGFVRNDSIFLQDIQIININTKFGAISNEKGEFFISVTIGDKIQFKSLQYTNRTIKISETHIKNKRMVVYLEEGINELNEVYLQKVEFDLQKIAVHKNAIMDIDFIDMQKPPSPYATTDPMYSAGGGVDLLSIFGSAVGLLYETIFKEKIKIKRSLKKKERKNRILQNEFITSFHNLYDQKFYTEELAIPEDEFYRFIDYCEGQGLRGLFNKNELIIKDFLIKQAKKYHEIRK